MENIRFNFINFDTQYFFYRFRALYKGLVPKILRLGPGGAIMLLVYEHVYNFLGQKFPD